MALHNDLGRNGEDIATEYLEKNGYKILERNWRFGRIEVDIIACNDDYLVFVEVKTRASDRWGNPEFSVTNDKIKRIVEAAESYINKFPIELPVRFDVISVIINGDKIELEHFDDAFFAPVN